jgi:hypothetical protein
MIDGRHNKTPLLNGGNGLFAGGGFRSKTAVAWPLFQKKRRLLCVN